MVYEGAKRKVWEMKQLQSLPLELKIRLTETRLREAVSEFGTDGLYVSWSGGKDSSVLRHIVSNVYPEIESVFCNTGLEYPEIQRLVNDEKKMGSPVTIIRPKMRFDEVVKKYGYPIISKDVSEKIRKARKNIQDGKYSLRLCQLGVMPHEYGGLKVDGKYDYFSQVERSKFSAKKYRPLIDVDFLISEECCWQLKKSAMIEYEKSTGRIPIIGMMADESNKRLQGWLKTGCNAFKSKHPQSNPMAFWTEQDVLEYIFLYGVKISDVYGEIVYAEEPSQMRLEEIARDGFGLRCDTLCATGVKRTGCIFCAYGAHISNNSDRFIRLKTTHPTQYDYCINGGEYDESGKWKPNKKGLGMWHVFDVLNEIYGAGFIKYK